MKRLGLIVILFCVAIILVMIFQKDDSFIKTGGLYISEIVASNSYTYKDSDDPTMIVFFGDHFLLHYFYTYIHKIPLYLYFLN